MLSPVLNALESSVLLHCHNEQLDQGSNASEVLSVDSSLKGDKGLKCNTLLATAV
jgi:hypothetical protein